MLECFPGQFRNWFYALLAMSTMMEEDRWADRTGGESQVVPPFKTLLGYALVRDEEGREMHKSLGNAIEFDAAAEKIGAEAMRYIFAAQNPTTNLSFPDISADRRKDVVHLDQEVQREPAHAVELLQLLRHLRRGGRHHPGDARGAARPALRARPLDPVQVPGAGPDSPATASSTTGSTC